MRRRFGGVAGSRVTDSGSSVLRFARGQAFTVEIGGDPVLDLTDPAGVLLAGGTITTDEVGRFAFCGPDVGAAGLWLDFGVGRVLVLASDLDDTMSATSAAANSARATVAAADARTTAFDASRSVPGGLAGLGVDGKVPSGQRPPPIVSPVLADLADVETAAATRGTPLGFDGALWQPTPARPLRIVLPKPAIVQDLGSIWFDEHHPMFGNDVLAAAQQAASLGLPIAVTISLSADGAVFVEPTDSRRGDTIAPTRGRYANSAFRPPATVNEPERMCTLFQLLAAVAGRTLVLMEPMWSDTGGVVPAAIGIVRQMRLEGCTGVLSTRFADTSASARAGLAKTVLRRVFSSSDQQLDIADILTNGIDTVLITNVISDALEVSLAAGLEVWTDSSFGSHVDRDQLLSIGFTGLVDMEALYMSDPALYRLKKSPFAGQVQPPGLMVPGPGYLGTFAPPDYWRPPALVGMQGWGCPIDASATNWTLTVNVRYDVLATNPGSAVWVFLGVDDRRFQAGNTDWFGGVRGYGIKIGFGGAVQLIRYDGQIPNPADPEGPYLNPVVTGPSGTSAAPTVGQELVYTITTTATAVAVAQGGLTRVAWNDATWRGRYFHVGYTRGVSGDPATISVKASYV